MSVTAYIALGSNLDHPQQYLKCAVGDIDAESGIRLIACSKLYRSDPVGQKNQPDYYNAVVSITTNLSPNDLLTCLQCIENKNGRVRNVHWGPRTLDLDILLYGDKILNTKQLVIPHYQMHLRPFVLYPLNDIAPNLVVPTHGKLSSLLDKVSFNGLDMISESWA
ncbi:MAG: 2-amino-4-hydroxy-6-hydroxymethyldihydropteridine diphosphokinase [Endozoicomonas sp. (ex Botrylloides leachii)]|nr:2-amino-4-hydroxy-6-hydroxymethyldihydropteridine diphosphokinase [Endozoicomonas sp. (ex Botrylloides leachii)]